MTFWMVDLLDRVGHRVLPGAPSPQDMRFRKVQGSTLAEAMTRARMEVTSLNKLNSIHNGEAIVMSDEELDWLIDQDVYPASVVSIPNPQRVGILDAYLVAQKSHPCMKAYADKVRADYESMPEIRQYRQASARV
jgi:hypothetical protein